MTEDPIVTAEGVEVMYVAGEAGRPISEQAPDAFRKLEAKIGSLRGRRFYGVVVGEEYRACVAIRPEDDPAALALARWTIPGGRYVRRRIPNWESNLHLIGSTFETFRRRDDFDPSRLCVEFYRSRQELLLMAPVR
jgi:hypothetical protein